ncbi:ABC transporter ATP-binding protein [Motilimonas eburnea]|uniref:ABC transporter ATP-binding protein n=1 Tax=Motilimonas eburnea TaxID=1737488 RepID=UPI001E65CA39|nr:ABC transporter ATP-binding protein [Motilimonas eburnea]MCE2570531.1 ABC transporter ATP-binding protein/permease [Motilimonas eburnea]
MPSTLVRLLRYSLHFKKNLALACALLLLATGLDMLAPWLTMIYIDEFVSQGHFPLAQLVQIALMYLGVIISANLISYCQSVSYFKLSAKVIYQLREQSFNHCLSLPMAYFQRRSQGEIIHTLSQDIEAVRHLFTHIIGRTIRDLVTVSAVIIAMLMLNVHLALVCIAFIPVFAIVFLAYRRYSLPLDRRLKQQAASINGFLNESLQQVLLLQVFNAQSRFSERLNAKAKQNIALNQRNIRLEALLLRPMLELLSILMMAALIISLGLLPREGANDALALGMLFAFFAYLSRFFEPLISLMQSQGELVQAIAAAERVFSLLDEPSETATGKHKLTNCPVIEFNQVSFGYEPHKQALNDISFRLQQGDMLALVGASGSGKSTIAQLLKGYYQTKQGNICLDGINIDDYQLASLRQGISLVEQKPFILSATLRQNLWLTQSHKDEALIQVLEQVGLGTWFKQLEQGLDTQLDNASDALTLGQKQLLCFARAMLCQSQVIILDEASASLDPDSERAIARVLDQLRAKVSLIVIAHKLSTITQADNILVLEQGEIEQQGTHDQLSQQNGHYRDLLHAQNPCTLKALA